MKKLILVLILTALISLSGCGGSVRPNILSDSNSEKSSQDSY